MLLSERERVCSELVRLDRSIISIWVVLVCLEGDLGVVWWVLRWSEGILGCLELGESMVIDLR